MTTNQKPLSGGPAGGQPGAPSGGTAEEARRKASEVAEGLEQKARARGEELRDQVEQQGEVQKERAAGTADAVADALRAAGSTLRDRSEERLGQFTDEFAEQVERFSGYLRDNDMRGLMHGLEDVARRNPAGFLGSTLAAGLVAGRFLRASNRDDDREGRGATESTARHRPPSHEEFASNSPTPELRTPREAAGSSSPVHQTGPGRDSPYTAGGTR